MCLLNTHSRWTLPSSNNNHSNNNHSHNKFNHHNRLSPTLDVCLNLIQDTHAVDKLKVVKSTCTHVTILPFACNKSCTKCFFGFIFNLENSGNFSQLICLSLNFERKEDNTHVQMYITTTRNVIL